MSERIFVRNGIAVLLDIACYIRTSKCCNLCRMSFDGILIVGGIVTAVFIGRQFWKRRRHVPRSIDMGSLSDAWLAEHRGITRY